MGCQIQRGSQSDSFSGRRCAESDKNADANVTFSKALQRFEARFQWQLRQTL